MVNEKGEKSKKLVPAGKVVPGVEVIWTVTANNVCKQPSEKVTINNPIPAHMSYVANSAAGPGSDISYSLDGKTFGAEEPAHGQRERRHAQGARRRIQAHPLGVQGLPAAGRRGVRALPRGAELVFV